MQVFSHSSGSCIIELNMIKCNEHATSMWNFLSFLSAAQIIPTPRTNVVSRSHCNLIDVDANLCHEHLFSDLEMHIKKANTAGISHMVVPGTTIEDSMQSLKIAKMYPDSIISCAGIHPYNVDAAGDVDRTMIRLKEIHSEPAVSCVGECGLDFSEGFPAPSLQIPYFERQVQLAIELQKPLFLHERLAHTPFTDILTRAESKLPPCLVHCFTGTESELAVYLKMGFYIGITGFIMKKNRGDEVKRCLKMIPVTRIMVETDAPYMGFPGCRASYNDPKKLYPNVPTSLTQIVEAVAKAMGVTAATLAKHSTENAREFFSITD